MQEKGGTSEIFLKYLLSHDLFLNEQLESAEK